MRSLCYHLGGLVVGLLIVQASCANAAEAAAGVPMSQGEIEAKIRANMSGYNFLTSQRREDGSLRMYFLQSSGARVWVDVDAVTGKIIGRGRADAASSSSAPPPRNDPAAEAAIVAGYEYCQAYDRKSGIFYIGPVKGGAEGPDLSADDLHRYNLNRMANGNDPSAASFESWLRQRHSLSDDTSFGCNFYPSAELARSKRRAFIDSTLQANRDHDAGYKIVEVN